MIALKCPEVQVVVLDINEGERQPRGAAAAGASGSARPTPSPNRPIAAGVARCCCCVAGLLHGWSLQTASLPGTATTCPSTSRACSRWCRRRAAATCFSAQTSASTWTKVQAAETCQQRPPASSKPHASSSCRLGNQRRAADSCLAVHACAPCAAGCARRRRAPPPSSMPADIIFVSVNTPTKTSGIGAGKAADLSYWESAARVIAQSCKGPAFKVVVEKSTVPVKTAEAIAKVRRRLLPHRRTCTPLGRCRRADALRLRRLRRAACVAAGAAHQRRPWRAV